MKKYLEEYIDKIKELPLKEKYTREDLLIEKFLVDKFKDIEIYYAPHNEYLNNKAKIFIVGITPGFQQMNTAIKTARICIEEGKTLEETKYLCKAAGRFSGSLRKNIISMLDKVELNKVIGINSCSELFEDKDHLLHTISLIPYPVFVKGKNYTGHTPKLIKSDFLMKYVNENFIEELNKLEDVFVIPLGSAVEEVLNNFIDNGMLNENQVLKGFPHPSGANVNRVVQLENNKKYLKEKIKSYFK